jgi:hypothetical protein
MSMRTTALPAILGLALSACSPANYAIEECNPAAARLSEQDTCRRLNEASGLDSCEPVLCEPATRKCVQMARDLDGDGAADERCGGGDKDDRDPTVRPGAEEICDGKDNDCNGAIDEKWPEIGATCTVGVGECSRSGTHICTPGDPSRTCCGDSTAKQCLVAGSPTTEECNGKDDDCDGKIDGPQCVCKPGDSQDCSPVNWPTGKPVGECRYGKMTCQANGVWGPCLDAVLPSAEQCNQKDDDCDGNTDEDSSGIAAACWTGNPGVCKAGTQVCSGGGIRCEQIQQATSFQDHKDSVTDSWDWNCDGKVEEETVSCVNCGGDFMKSFCTAGNVGAQVCCDASCGNPTNTFKCVMLGGVPPVPCPVLVESHVQRCR